MAKILFLVSLICMIAACSASHFRFGSISWSPASPTNYNYINFNILLGYKRNYGSFYNVTVGDYVKGGSRYNQYNYTGSDLGTITFGYNNQRVTPICYVNSINANEDWFTCTMVAQFTYPSSKGKYSVSFDGSARLSSLINNANQNYRCQTTVTITPPPGITYDSPVSGVLPIITVNRGVLNTFQIVASNPLASLNQNLTYSLATGSMMGSSYLANPSGLTVSTGGIVSFTPTQTGLYCAQIIIDDGIDYVVTDFILNSVVQPISPPYFFGLTPGDGSLIRANVNQTTTWTYEAKSNNTNLGVTIYSANVPAGVECSKQDNPNPGRIDCSWTPSINNVGSYVVSLGLYDSAGTPMQGQRSFILTVQQPQCGNGSPIQNCVGNECCKCDPGFDTASNCFECLPGFWGPKCQTNPPCKNGTVSEGTTGNGACICYNGYTGAACDIVLSLYCNSADTTGLTSADLSQGYLNPQNMIVYVSNTGPSYTLPVNLTLPSPLPSVDVYVLIDAAPTNTAIQNDYKNYITTFVNSIQSYSDNVRLGYGTYSDALSGYVFQNKLVIGSTINIDIQNLPYVISTTSTGNGLAALQKAAETSVGWRAASYHSLLIITDSDIVAPTQALSDAVTDALIKNNIVPVVIGVNNAKLDNWNAFLTANKFGKSAVSKNTNSNDWALTANKLIQSSFLEISPVANINPEGFIFNTLPKQTITLPGVINLGFQVKMPTTPVATNQGQAQITVPGYGDTNLIFKFNHAPTASPGVVTALRNKDTPFTFLVSDPDANQLDIKFVSLPDKAVASITANGVTVVLGGSYLSTSTFLVVPAKNAMGSTSFNYEVTDRCLTAASSFSVKVIDDGAGTPPNAFPTNVSTIQNTPVAFQFNFTDDNKPASKCVINLITLPKNGRITYPNGNAVPVNTDIEVGTFTYTPNTDKSDADTNDGNGPLDTIYFTITNDKGYSSSSAIATFYVSPRNPPVYTGQLEFITLQNTPLPILLTGNPPAGKTLFKYVFDEFKGPGNMSYLQCAEEPHCYLLFTPPFETLYIASRAQFLYQPPNDVWGNKIFNISLHLETDGVISELINISITVVHVPQPPKIVLETLQVVGEEQESPLKKSYEIVVNQSAIVSWSSYDLDTDNNTIECIIQTLPRRGSLHRYNDSAEDKRGEQISLLENIGKPTDSVWKVVYAPVPGTSGPGYATFSFKTFNTLQLYSLTEQLITNVNPIYTPPEIFVGQYNWTSMKDQALVITNVSFVSVDVTYQNMTMLINITNQDLSPANVSIDLFGLTPGYCVSNVTGTLLCRASKTVLNNYLSQINVASSVAGNYMLNVWVENTHLKSVPGLTPELLTANNNLSVGFSAAGVKNTNNTTVLSAAIAASVAAAALIAAAVWKLVKRAAPPTDAFFGDSPFSEGGISSNPLYQESANSGVNPLYDASTN
ncbi:type A von Willebrand factor domain-containing protein [Heterostelium album PN500]|uniref:Type A von Willebrand factor domain-containing protein n=1 Tax=Heterostelium pallidum (strain ATCC 26659 / Pp 5 / PN500) TaxID=670386 RepID=D3BTJ3_HETP5|nr:type A von Willebrand factor domain-containing protein [Heterostelium album PN500]EFA75410.1 type A von Willebrand factor domain-containing protein [Heterostelium album PN500]|eukprot:XP_020427544.1 type A von Willebrand factor domain-containing protein [Heterostelium album PN500]